MIFTFLLMFLLQSGTSAQPETFRLMQDPHRTLVPSEFHRIGRAADRLEQERLYMEVHGQLWIRFSPDLDSGENHVYLHMPNFFHRIVDVYTADHSTGDASLVGTMGMDRPYQGFHGLTYAMRIPDLDSNHDIVLRIHGDDVVISPNYIPIRTGSAEDILNYARNDASISKAISAIILGLFLFNLVLLFVVKHRLYFYYVLYIFSVMLLNFFMNGYLFEYLWPGNPELNSLEIPLTLSYLTFLLFINQLIVKHVRYSWYGIAYRVLLGIVLMVPFTLFIDAVPSELLTDVLGIFIPLFTIGSICSVRTAVFRNYLLVGYVPLMISVFLLTLTELDFFFHPFIRMHVLQLGIVWELIVFSVYLGSRYNKLDSIRKVYKDQNSRLLSDYATRLEETIRKRTAELNEKNELLRRQREKISSQRDLLISSNERLEQQRIALEKYNKTLESTVKDRTNKLLKTNDYLETQLKSLEQFSFIAAHNLRGPLARIKGLAGLLELEHPGLSPELLDKMKYAMEDMDEIVTDLGTIIDMQNIAPDWHVVNVEGMINQVRERLDPQQREMVDWRIDIGVSDISVIPAYFVSILFQCISNSLKFRSEQRRLVIQIRIQEEKECIYLTYSDNGIGFDSDRFRDKLFEPFQRFNTVREGKGLGLFIVKRHVDAMGGNVRVISVPDKGTKFDIELPVRVA